MNQSEKMDIYSDVSMISGASSSVSSASSRSTASSALSTVDQEASLLRAHNKKPANKVRQQHRRQHSHHIHHNSVVVRSPEILIDPVPAHQNSGGRDPHSAHQRPQSATTLSPQTKETSECYKMTICSLTFVLFIVSLALIASVIILVYVIPNSTKSSSSSKQVGRICLSIFASNYFDAILNSLGK